MKVDVIMRVLDNKSSIKIVYCGYLELNDTSAQKTIWDWCNWKHWSEERPKECKHLLIDTCNSDMAYRENEIWFSHRGIPFSTLDECLKEMENSDSEFFFSLWPMPEGVEEFHR